ncbi:hypothetical protein CSUB01_11784 [Colletotrichum sublineola]|uniref:Uncharacterized protein n=1 Tax=Colletotrichum sublineola TaxID=1173701 RepID=A0A066XMI0_COLSU|nr:hypothetical protein CSUB01_11784 [Colletotrichum sublineola]
MSISSTSLVPPEKDLGTPNIMDCKEQSYKPLMSEDTRDSESVTDSMYSIAPALEAVEFIQLDFDDAFNSTSIYRGPPTPEREKAWFDLTYKHAVEIPEDKLAGLNRSLEDNLERVPPEVGTGFVALLEVFHQLHCLAITPQVSSNVTANAIHNYRRIDVNYLKDIFKHPEIFPTMCQSINSLIAQLYGYTLIPSPKLNSTPRLRIHLATFIVWLITCINSITSTKVTYAKLKACNAKFFNNGHRYVHCGAPDHKYYFAHPNLIPVEQPHQKNLLEQVRRHHYTNAYRENTIVSSQPDLSKSVFGLIDSSAITD